MNGLTGFINFSKNSFKDYEIKKDSIWQLFSGSDFLDEIASKDTYSICSSLGIIRKEALGKYGNISILLFGEIYNKSLKYDKQIEYIAEEYESKGLEFVNNLNGSFSFILLDQNKNITLLVSDRLSTRPIFYTFKEDIIYFSSNVETLVKISSIDKKIDWAATVELITQGFTTNNKSLVKNVKMLDYASMIVISDNSYKVKKYWNFKFNDSKTDKGFEYYSKRLYDLCENAVSRSLFSDHKYGLFLSGGYDSRVILSLMKGKKDIKAISFGTEKSETYPFGDVEIAKKAALVESIDFKIYNYGLEHMFDTLSSVSSLSSSLSRPLPEWPIHKAIRKDGIDIVLTGDEIFGRPSVSINNLSSALSCSTIFALSSYKREKLPFRDNLFDKISKISNINKLQLKSKYDYANLLDSTDGFFMSDYMISCIGMWRSATMNEIEIRNPFYDREILEFICNLPAKYRFNKILFKRTFKKFNKEQFKVPIARGVSKPDEKDWNSWFFNNREKLKLELSKGQTKIDKIIDYEKIFSYLDNISFSETQSLSSHLKGSKGQQNWIKSSPDFFYESYLFLLKAFILVRSIVTGLPLYKPNLKMREYIINIIRARQTLIRIGI